jgi:hydroxyethylthiazole kinase
MHQADLTNVLSRLRAAAPLVHNITNQVVANVTANALLAIGASPAMVQAEEEVGSFVRLAAALVVNIGTLTAPQLAAMHIATQVAGEAGVPWILDPVAAGATPFRLQAARDLIRRQPAVVRGNASEILALAGESVTSKGVDSTHGSGAALQAAKHLSAEYGAVVAVTGAVDYVTDGQLTWAIANGHPMLTRVTGTGCTATALIGSFLGAGLPAMQAALAGLAVMGVVGEQAATKATAPGSFQVAILDGLHELDDATLASRARVALA